MQSNGQIVMVGQSSQAFTAVRYNSDGSLDSGFGTGGIVTTAIPATTRSAANALTIQTDGRLIVAGQGSYSIEGPHGMQQNQEIVLVRYNTDGTLDSGSSQATPSLAFSPPGADDSLLVPLAIDDPYFQGHCAPQTPISPNLTTHPRSLMEPMQSTQRLSF